MPQFEVFCNYSYYVCMSKLISDKQKVFEFLNSRYIDTVFPSKEKAAELLSGGERLSFYLGIDPTGSELHLGHTTNFFVLKKLFELGHKIILLIGDFTAQTGDPTGKDTARKVLSEAEVKENMKTYIKQAQKILPKGSFEVRHNSRWLSKLNFADIRKLARLVTVQQMFARDMFQKRIKEDKSISLEEFLYPLMQGYDSVAMEVDGEIGGTDQTFNMMVGRDLSRSLLNKEKIVITTKLLEDKETGKKLMSKSEGRYVSLEDDSQSMFGKVMALPDSAILTLFNYTTQVPDEKVTEIKDRLASGENPKNVKEELAFELTRMYYREKEALKAKEEFERVFSQHQLPENIQEILWKGDLASTSIAAGIVSSKGEIKRLVEQKAVKVRDEVVESWDQKIEIPDEGVLLKIGPRRFFRIKN